MSIFLPKPGSRLLVALLVTAGACQPEAERDDTAGYTTEAGVLDEATTADSVANSYPGSEYEGRAFTFHRIRDDIWHAVGTGNLAVGANAAIVINEDHVLLVDSHVSPAAARALLEELRSITSLPVRYVVNTHFHFDHAHGNQVYPDPVEIIGHEFTREMIASGESVGGRTYRTDIGMLPERIEAVTRELEAATDPDERARFERRLGILENYKAATDAVEPTPPTLTLERRLTIFRGEREIHVLFFGRGHTGGDVVVHLPEDGVLITGDLLNSELPYMGDAHLIEWANTLEHLKDLEFDVILPGHGEAFEEREKIDHLQLYLRDLHAQAVDLYHDGLSAEAAAKQIDMQTHADHYPFIDGPGVPPRTVERVYDLLDQREGADR